MIVYTRGRIPNSDQDYRATEDSEFTDLPMVVITNRSSASASEIFAGALQDHDRAIIVGETTFGKALVQSVYRISGGAGLALTTAHYYTPSGRLIQRPWDETFDEYLAYTQREQDVNRQHNAERSEAHRLPAGRSTAAAASSPTSTSPGFPRPIDGIGFNPTPFGRMLVPRPSGVRELRRQVHGRRRHADRPEGDRTRRASRRTSPLTTRWWTTSRSILKSERIKIDEEAFQKDLDFIKAMIRFRIDEAVFGVADAQTPPGRGRSAGAAGADAVR